jgi:ADP-heptose:LPS heptosyltransferase/Flp pilus assembly protein TadD
LELPEVAEQLFSSVFGSETKIADREELCAVAGSSALARGDYSSARKIYETGLSKGFRHHTMVLNLSLVELILGDYLQGWEHYLIRGLQQGVARLTLPESIPHWQGESVVGKTILISSEQGIGDMIQFVRFVPELEKIGARVVFASYQDVLGLLRNDPRARKTEISALTEDDIDFHALLLDLPCRLGMKRPEDIPRNIPYLFANLEKADLWRSSLAGFNGLKVGIAWAGNPDFAGDHYRSASINVFSPLAGMQGVTFFGLQKGVGAKEALCPPEGLPYFWIGDQFASFEDTAAAIVNLDLVISTDTSIVHLAAALGKPVWLLLSRRSPDYRWVEFENGNVWYPNVRIFRQEIDDDWVGCVRDLLRPALAENVLAKLSEVAHRWQKLSLALDSKALQWDCADWTAWAKDVVLASASVEASGWLARVFSERDASEAIYVLLAACVEQGAVAPSLEILHARLLLKLSDDEGARNLFQSVLGRLGSEAVGRAGALDWGWHHFDKSEWHLAHEIWSRAVEAFPRDGHLHYLVGIALRSIGKEKNALLSFQVALSHTPRHYTAMQAIAELLRAEKPDVAWAAAQKAALLKRNDVSVWQTIVRLFHERGMYFLAERILLAKGNFENNLTSRLLRARQLIMLGRIQEGRQLLKNAPVPSSASVEQKLDYAHALYQSGMRNEALVSLEFLPASHPTSREARFTLGFYQLRMGDYEEGWKNYWLSMRRDGIWRFSEWKGESIKGKSILVVQDQGQGDVVQFFPLLRELWLLQPRRMVVAVSVALVTLFRSQEPYFDIVNKDELDWDDYRFDFQVDQMALPYLLNVNLLRPRHTQPSFLVSPNHLSPKWRKFIENDSNLRVGIVWSGGDSFKANYVRSTTLEDWRILWGLEGVSFYSLQKDVNSNQAAVFGLPLQNIAADCPTWLETLAAIDSLDLVITTCTAVAHVAGSINKPTWIVLSNEYVDFRWLEEREDSPWYPSVRLIRRQKGETWPSVFSRIAQMLLKHYKQLQWKIDARELHEAI